jgi:4-hydroxy-3-polyprenylbenzoate decarboxylase
MRDSLRGFLSELERIGELVRIKEEVQGEEIFTILWKLYHEHGPAVIFENVKGHNVPIVANVFGTLDRYAMACGFPRGKSAKDYRDIYLEILGKSESWPKTKLVTSAPCKEVILRGKEAKFSCLPIFKWHPKDGGPYITLPAEITRDSKLGTNVGIYRMMIHDDYSSCIMCSVFQHQGIFLGRAMRQGKEKLDCVVALGANPAVYIAAVTSIELGKNELELAGALLGKPLEVVKAETCDIEVPADSEIILEGEISTTERKKEAPFAEYGGYFEETTVLPVFKLKCITMRKNAMYQMTTAYNEGELLRLIPLNAMFVRYMKERVTGFVDCWLPESGHGYTAIVSIKKYFPGWGQEAIYQVLGAPFVATIVNNIIIVDPDIDPSNLSELVWALSTRVDPYYDVIITKPMPGDHLNPAARGRMGVYKATGSNEFLVCSKMGIDATLKTSEERPERGDILPTRPPEEILSNIGKKWSALGLGNKQ